MRELGGVVGLAVLVAVFAGFGGYGSPAAFLDGFSPAVGIGAGLVALGAVAGTFVRRPSRTPCGVEDPAVEHEPISC